MTPGQVVTDRIPFGEGPVWCPDATVVCTSVSHGALFKVWPDDGRTEMLVETGGGANAALLVSDGSFALTQNGGIDLVALGHVKDAPPVRWMTPGLQWARLDGTVEYLTSVPMQAPNDLVASTDGSIYFTDPSSYPPTGRISRVMAYRPDGICEVVADGFGYTNGIALDTEENCLVVVVDDLQLVRMHDMGKGSQELAIEHLGETGGDGLCLDVDGRYYVALRRGNGIGVFEHDGSQVDFLALEAGDGFVTNCCFGGPEMRTLFATDARRGRLVAWEGMPVRGLEVASWNGPT